LVLSNHVANRTENLFTVSLSHVGQAIFISSCVHNENRELRATLLAHFVFQKQVHFRASYTPKQPKETLPIKTFTTIVTCSAFISRLTFTRASSGLSRSAMSGRLRLATSYFTFDFIAIHSSVIVSRSCCNPSLHLSSASISR